MNSSARDTTLSQDIGTYLRYQLRGRRGLIAAAIVLAVPALWLGWPWLVAAGLAPLLLAAAPCAVMCALGLCMHRAASRSGVGSSEAAEATPPQSQLASGVPESGSLPSSASGCPACDNAPETTASTDGAAKPPTQMKETMQ